jgi:hypothetical protein
MNLIDPHHPFYRPLGRRIVITAVTGVWFGLEALAARDPFWSVLTGALFAYTGWVLLVRFPGNPAG